MNKNSGHAELNNKDDFQRGQSKDHFIYLFLQLISNKIKDGIDLGSIQGSTEKFKGLAVSLTP